MRVAVIVDRKDKADQRDEIEGSYAYQLQKWLKVAGLNSVQVWRLGNNTYDEQIFECDRVRLKLEEYKPDFIIGLGKMALMYLKGKAAFGFNKKGECDASLDNERGAPFINAITGCPCICTYTPRYVFMLYAYNVIVEHDFMKAARLAASGWVEPKYNLNFTPTFSEMKSTLQMLIDTRCEVASDIETFGKGRMSCIGFAWSETDGLVVPLVNYNLNGESRSLSTEQQHEILLMIKDVLENNKIIGQNFVHFDHYILLSRYGIVAKCVEDTMLGFWELYPSFDKNLGFISSILTDNKYWKGMLKESRNGKVPRWEEFRYNGLDCIVDYQCAMRIREQLLDKPSQEKHYRFNLRTSRAYQYMSFEGCRIDKDKHAALKSEYSRKVNETQLLLNEQAGKVINVRSSTQMKEWLYKDLGLPQQKKAVKDRFGNREARESADSLSVYKLAGEFPQIEALTTASRLRKLKKKLSDLEAIDTDDKGVCRWSFNCVGTKVGRSSGYKPLYDPGVQPQNVDKAFRDLFIPPDGMVWLKADLEGADSVTMGACMKALGDSRLMDDIDHKIKPAQTVALEILTGKPYTSYSQAQILADKHLLKEPKGKKAYKVTKAVNHGSAYKLGFVGMSENMLRISEGELYVSPRECETAQKKLFSRYNYPLYHQAIHRIMMNDPYLKAANGQVRRFYGRQDGAMHREMCSYLPQVHTAFVTNTVIERFYYDKAARKGDRLLLQLCNQVHDELCGFVYEDEVDEVEKLFQQFWRVPLTIWNVPFLIEFEAQVGPTWGTMIRDLKLA